MSLAILEEVEQSERGSATIRRWVHVATDRRGWYVRLVGSSHLVRYPNITQAIHHARRLAHQHEPASLLIRYSDGEQEESAYESPAGP